eukprot:512563_1
MVHGWEHLHNIKHIDHHFHTIENSFVCPSSFNNIWQVDTTPYQQSIQMFAIIPITFGLIYFLGSFLWVTISCYKSYGNYNNQSSQHQQESIQQQLLSDNNIYRINNNDDKHFAPLSINSHSNLNENIQTHTNSKQISIFTFISQYILTFLSLCIIIFSIYIGIELNSTIINVENNWDDSYKPYNTCIYYGHSIENILQSVIDQCKSIRNAHLPFDCQDALPILDEIIPKIENSLYYLNKYIHNGEVISWGNSSQINPYRKYLIYGGIILVLFIAILIIISFIKICINKYIWCNILLSYFLTYSILCIWIISSIQFAFSIEVSDACVNPQNT